MSRRKLAAPAMLAALLLMLSTSVAAAYTQDPYNSSYNNTESTNCWCVPAATRTWSLYLGYAAPSQGTIENWEQTHDKYSWPQCSPGVPGGNDPRGWAWGMWEYSPSGYGFNDYWSTSQSYMDWELVYGIRADNHPDGALVVSGLHAVDVIGYYTLNDPFSTQQQTLYGFYILDPWYGKGASGLPNWPYNGFSPNSYVTVSNWNSLYFLRDTNDGAFWDPPGSNGYYVAVLRASTDAQPSDNPPETYGDYVYNHTVGPVPASLYSADTLASATSSPTIESAVSQGIEANDLQQGGSLGVSLAGYSVGPSVHVDSLAEEIPSYDLVQVTVAGQLRAIAMVTESTQGYAFVGIMPWSGTFEIGTPAGLAQAVASNGLAGSGRLVWAWAKEGGSPFTPFIEATDPASGAVSFLTVTGRYSSIHLIPGETAGGS